MGTTNFVEELSDILSYATITFFLNICFKLHSTMALIGNYGTRMLPLLARRGLATTAIKQEVHPVYFKMKETTKYFQINNGQHVHERGRFNMPIIYGLLVGSVVVLGGVMEFVYSRAFPPKLG